MFLVSIANTVIPYTIFAALAYIIAKKTGTTPLHPGALARPIANRAPRKAVIIAAPFAYLLCMAIGYIFWPIGLAAYLYGIFAAYLAGIANGRGIIGQPSQNLPYQA